MPTSVEKIAIERSNKLRSRVSEFMSEAQPGDSRFMALVDLEAEYGLEVRIDGSTKGLAKGLFGSDGEMMLERAKAELRLAEGTLSVLAAKIIERNGEVVGYLGARQNLREMFSMISDQRDMAAIARDIRNDIVRRK